MVGGMIRFILPLLAALLLAAPAAAQFVTGIATVTDGDSMRVDGERIRLYGVAAPEIDRTCPIAGGREWKCGIVSRDFLTAMAALGPVYCEGIERDQYGRLLAICDAYDGRSINEEMVRSGMAWAFTRYADDYLPEEREARAAGIGVWQGGR